MFSFVIPLSPVVRTAEAATGISKQINFQGKLTAVSDGTNVANGTYAFEFKIYDAASSGTLLWTETFDQPSGACGKLTVTSGIFNAKLGSCNSLSSVDFSTDSLYVSVNFAPTGTSYDGEMSPRKQLVASAYAFSANGLAGNGTINLLNTGSNQATIGYDSSNKLQVNVASNGFNTLTANGAGAGFALMGGNVGIGTTTVSAKLHSLATTEQLRLGYDASNYASFTTSSAGNLTVAPSGGTLNVTGITTVSSILQVGSATAAAYSRLGTASTGHSLSGASSLLTSGDLEVDGTTYLDGALTVAGAATYNGNITVTKQDPALVLNGGTGSDTDFWLGVTDDNGNDDDDLFQIGDGTTPGTNPFITINTSGNVGIGTTTASSLLTLGGGGVARFNNPANDYSYTAGTDSGNLFNITGGGSALQFELTSSAPRIMNTTGASIQLSSNDINFNANDGGVVNFGKRSDGAFANQLDYRFSQLVGSNIFAGLGNQGQVTLTSGLNQDDLLIKRNVTGSFTEAGSLLHLQKDITGSSTYNGSYLLWGTTAADLGTINSSGSLGVGTTTVSAKIHSLATTEQLRLGYDAANYASFTTSSGGDLTIAPSGGDTTVTGNFTITGTCTGCGGSSTLNGITAATADDTDNDNTNKQIAWDWSTLSTQTAFKLQATGTGLTSGSLFNVTSATTGAVTNGIAKFSASGNYSGTGGVLNVSATASTAGTLANFSNNTASYTGNLISAAANGITSGKIITASSSAAANFTGNLVDISLSDGTGASSNTGSLLMLTNSGTANANTTLYVKHYADDASSYAFRVDDVSSDSTPTVINKDGQFIVGRTTTSNADGNAIATFYKDTTGTPAFVKIELNNPDSASGAGTNIRYYQGTTITAGTLFDNNLDKFVIRAQKDSSAYITLETGGSGNERVRIDATGNVGIGTVSPDGLLELGGNRTASAWGLNGIALQGTAATYTDSSSSGTVTNVVANSLGTPTFAASSATTYTNAASLYIAANPTAGSNVTITNGYALWVDSGVTRLDGNLQTNVTGSTQCLHVDTNGVVSGTGSDCGSGGSQTPWTSAIDADAFALQDALNIEFRTAAGSAPAGSVIAVFADNSGDLTANVLTGKTYNIAVNGSDEYNFSSTALAMNSNNITGIGTAITGAAGMTITATSADLALATATSGNITIAPASTGSVQITSGVTTGTGTSAGLSITSSTVTSGTLVDISVTTGSSTLTGQKALSVSVSGTNTGTKSTYAGYFSNTRSNTSGPNIGLYATASGSSIGNNYAAIFESGKVGINIISPSAGSILQVSPVQYNTGTASQSTSTITGSGTTWTAAMVGSEFVFADGTRRTITAFTDATHLTVTGSGTVSSQAYTINHPGLKVDDQGSVQIGAISNPSSNSRLYVYGGSNGANIDARGNANISDQAIMELEGSDYDSVPNSVRLEYYGPSGTGTTMGFSNNKLGNLSFGGASTAIIKTDNAIPLIFGTNLTERMRLDGSGNLVIGTTTATGLLDVNNTTTAAITAGANARVVNIQGSFTEAASGTHARIVGVEITPPTITGGVASVTNTASLYVSDAPTASGATNYALWVDSGVTRLDGNLQVNVTGSTQCLTADTNGVVSGTGSACGAGGASSLNGITAATADDTNNDNTNYQIAWDWSTLTTQNAFKLQGSGTGLTSGSLFSVASATTGAVSNGIAQFSASGNYSGTGGVLNVSAGASTAGTLASFTNNTASFTGTGINASFTGTTTGNDIVIAPGSGVTSGSALQINASGTSAIANGLFQINHTGAFTSSGGLMKLTADSTTAGTVASISANALQGGTGLAISSTATTGVTGSLFTLTSSTTTGAGAIQSISTTGLNGTGAALKVTGPSGATAVTNGLVQITAAGDYTGTGGLLNVSAGASTAGTLASFANNTASFTGNLIAAAANGITSGTILSASSSAAASFTGNLIDISLSDGTGASSNTGSLLMLTNAGTANANTTLYVKHYATGTNNLALRVDDVSGDTTPFVINGAGAVGIGTTAPGKNLEVQGTGDQAIGILATDNSAPHLFFGRNGTYEAAINYNKNAGSDLQFWVGGVTSSSRVATMLSSGNVGIGNDESPDYKLEISSATGSNSTFALTDDDVATALTSLVNTDSFFHVGPISSTAGGARITATSDADGSGAQPFEIRGIFGNAVDPTDTVPAVKIIGGKGSSNTIADLGAAETVFQVANNDDTAAITVLGNSNVGIGTVTPAARLDVLSATEQLRLSYDASNYVSYTVSSAGTLTNALKSNTQNALRITDGTNPYLTIDTRTTASGVSAISLAAATAPTIASASGAQYLTTTVTPGIYNITGGTSITGTGTSSMLGVLINQPTLAWNTLSSPTITEASNVYINGAIKNGNISGGSPVVTESSALRIGSASVVSGNGLVTSSYALYASAQTGAANNYAAVFQGGNVGIGTTTPTSLLHVQQFADSTSTSAPVGFDVNSVGAAGELTASSGSQTFARIAPIVNQSATASYNAAIINATETATGTGEKNLLDLQLAGASRTTIASNGALTLQDASPLQTPYGGFGRYENHLTRSESFDHADWVKTSVTAPTADAQTAPDGSATAESLATSGSGGDVCNFTGTAAGSNTFTFSVWVKAASGTQSFGLRIDAGATSCATANNVTGTEQTFTATTTWKRYQVTKTFSSATGNVKARIFPGTSSGTGTVYAWGAQVEQASSANLYTKVVSAALTNTNRGQMIESNYTAVSGTLFGSRNITHITGTAVASSTQVGQLIRIIDDTSSGVNSTTTRALEVQGFSGTNIKGINTGVASFGYTFGVHAVTTAQANEQAQPAAVFADLDNGSAPTQGNAIRAYTDNATSANLVHFYQETTTMTGAGLLMNFANNSGGFTGNYIDLQKAGTSRFTIDDTGAIAMLNIPDADNEIAIEIDTEESTGTQDIFRLVTDTATNDSEKFRIESSGAIFVSLPGTQTTRAVCHTNSGTSTTSTEELVDCDPSAGADFAEMYPVEVGTEVGDVVALGSGLVNTYNQDSSGTADWDSVKGKINKLVKATSAHQSNLVGIVSDNYTDFGSTGYNIKAQDNPKSIALAGRVLVKISDENGVVHAGDYITSSGTRPGYAMKATHPGMVLGQALADHDGSGKVMVFVQTFYYDPGVSIDQSGNVNLQRGQSSTQITTATDNTAAYLIKQQSTGNILQLQSNDTNRLMVASSGSLTINADVSLDTDLIVVAKRADQDQFTINARGDVQIFGSIIMKNDTFAGSIVTDEEGKAEVRFSYDLGTGKPVVQLTPESETPTFAQVSSWIKDGDGNYIGFNLATYGLGGTAIRAIVHFNVTGKQESYETNGTNALKVSQQPLQNNEIIFTFSIINQIEQPQNSTTNSGGTSGQSSGNNGEQSDEPASEPAPEATPDEGVSDNQPEQTPDPAPSEQVNE